MTNILLMHFFFQFNHTANQLVDKMLSQVQLIFHVHQLISPSDPEIVVWWYVFIHFPNDLHSLKAAGVTWVLNDATDPGMDEARA